MAMTMPLTTAAQSRKTDWGTTLTPQKKDTVKVVKGAAEATKDTVKTANGAAKVAKDTIKATKCIEAAISTEALSTPDTAQTVQAETPLTLTPDTLTQKKKRDWSTWRPETKRAMWLALVLPGAGQIYNRKYWKLPIIYGGFVGCAYALRWNNMMYKDYSQAYMDLMDNDPNTQSYNKFLYLGNQIDNSNKEYYQKLFKNRKDRYRKWRDMSVFAMVGVYLISVVDAYVDASLSEFDISRDLSMKVSPAVIKERSEWTSYNPLNSSAVGLQCSLTF